MTVKPSQADLLRTWVTEESGGRLGLNEYVASNLLARAKDPDWTGRPAVKWVKARIAWVHGSIDRDAFAERLLDHVKAEAARIENPHPDDPLGGRERIEGDLRDYLRDLNLLVDRHRREQDSLERRLDGLLVRAEEIGYQAADVAAALNRGQEGDELRYTPRSISERTKRAKEIRQLEDRR